MADDEDDKKTFHVTGIAGWIIVVLAVLGFVDLLKLAFKLGSGH